MADRFDRSMMLCELLSGECVPFLGAGCSLGARLPSASELREQLAQRATLKRKETRGHRDCQHTCAEHGSGLDAVASYFAVKESRPSLDNFLRDRFQDSAPLPIHKFLAKLPKPLLIITTNYDQLMESALRGSATRPGRPFDVLAFMPNDDDRPLTWFRYDELGNIAEGPLPWVSPQRLFQRIDLEKRTLVYKIHGSQAADRGFEGGRFLITQEDYERALLDLDQFLPPVILEHLDGRRLLFLGHSVRDWNIRALIRRLLEHMRQPSHAVVHSVSEMERLIWRDRLKFEEVDINLLVQELEGVRVE